MDFEPLLTFLQPHLPSFAFHLLSSLTASLSSTIDIIIYALMHPSDPDSAEALKSLVPSLLSFLMLYFAVISVYRTVRSTISLLFFLVKWVGILGALGLVLSYLMRGGNAEDFSNLAARFHTFEAAYKEHVNPPKGGNTGSRSIWDRFDARERQNGDKEKSRQKDKDTPSPDPSSTIEYVYEQIAGYKWVVDALFDNKDNVKAKVRKEKTKPRTTPKNKAGQRVR